MKSIDSELRQEYTDWGLRERIVRLEEKMLASSDALKLARESVSKNNLGLIGTFVLALLGLVIQWLARK